MTTTTLTWEQGAPHVLALLLRGLPAEAQPPALGFRGAWEEEISFDEYGEPAFDFDLRLSR